MSDITIPEGFLPYPLPPWEHDFRSLSVFAEVDERDILPFIPEPLTLASNIVQFSVMYFGSTVPTTPYYDSGPIVQVKYGDQVGGHWICCLTSRDEVLSGIRETWGYRAKLADKIELTEGGDEIRGVTTRLGKRVISIKMDRTGREFNTPSYFPRIFLKVTPRADRAEADVKKVVVMEAPTQVAEVITGEGSIEMEQSETDPFYRLRPRKIIGASFTTGHQILPWGREVG